MFSSGLQGASRTEFDAVMEVLFSSFRTNKTLAPLFKQTGRERQLPKIMMSVYSDCFPRNSAKTQMLSERHGPKNIEDASHATGAY